ncbi:hypothetical protein XELAEV_18016419mg [Xenopus laevis]|uniref:Uncharacterized protein n=1 Tax=Xenopus laevis TaxID=8355 RepID=A0A974DKG8_XENLA|nr:hypothetical protein XELAEV_18016419mg [Xenopus laevis]
MWFNWQKESLGPFSLPINAESLQLLYIFPAISFTESLPTGTFFHTCITPISLLDVFSSVQHVIPTWLLHLMECFYHIRCTSLSWGTYSSSMKHAKPFSIPLLSINHSPLDFQ